MKVTRLEVFGFKSFMDRLILPLDSGITGVVGPNGCGKSNIVDALRWVLGETNAKHLRGTLLEDVIFNGTDALRPLGLAEVTITLRAAGEEFFGDLVSPNLEAELIAAESTVEQTGAALSSDSEINETSLEIVSADGQYPEHDGDQVPGSEGRGLHVIEGGKDAEVPLETQTGDEPARSAGDLPPTLLHKLSWLRSVNEVQVTRRLYRSGESEFFINRVPCRLRDLKDLFRAVGIGARTYTIVAQGEVSRIVTAKPEERRGILEEAAGVLGFRDKIAAAERRLNETDIDISRIDDIVKEVTRQVNSLRQQAARAKNRQSLKDDLRSIEISLFQDRSNQLTMREGAIAAELKIATDGDENAHATLSRAQSDEEYARNELLRVDVEGDTLRAQIDSIQEELNTRMRRRAEHASKIGEAEAYASSAQATIERLSTQREVLKSRSEQIQKAIAELRAEGQKLGGLNAVDQDGHPHSDELSQISKELEQARNALRDRDRALQSTREDLVRLTAELASCEEQLSPYGAQATGSALPSELKDAKALATSLTVPEELVVAVEAALSNRAKHLVVSDPLKLGRSISAELCRGAEIGEIGLLESGEERSPSATAAPGAVPFPRLLDRITVAKSAERGAAFALSGVYLAPTAHEATSWLESLPGGTTLRGVRIVTPLGEIVEQQSYSIANGKGAVSLRKRIEQLKLRIIEAERAEDQCKAERDLASNRVGDFEERQRMLLQIEQERSSNARKIGSEQGVVLGRLSSEERSLENVTQDLIAVEQELSRTAAKGQEMAQEATRVREQVATLTEDRERELEATIRNLELRNREIEAERRQGRETLSNLINVVNEARNSLDQARETASALRLEEQKLRLDREHLRQRLQEEYGDEALSVVVDQIQIEALSEERIAELTDEAAKLRTRLSREGEVNPEAIEQYDVEQKRLEELVAQRRDLAQASLTLRKTIERLKETSINRFLSTFEQVKENFSILVPRLFGGGKGTLELLDPSNPLQSGVEIIARPPGKKLKQLELLSGGEKAMCATALIFAMFLVRPSPLCVLDEVDAPLDDANLARFLSLIKEMSTKTQFIMITHNKQSMGTVDRLVGVTMEQPGASKLITVSLEEAYKQVA